MGRHFVHFNRRDIRLRFPADPADPWYAEFQRGSKGFGTPEFHVTRASSGKAAEIESGDVIWLVGQLYAPWGERFPATIDAKIVVASANKRNDKPGYRYVADSSSTWFALTDATEQLQALTSISAKNGVSSLWLDRSLPIGHYLRRIRELANGEVLLDWELQQQSRPLHFVSYRIRDGTRSAFHCARVLFDEKKRVFWDRWCLPRRLAERREAVGPRPLDKTLKTAIEQAEVVWGVESPLYSAAGSYAVRERELACRLNKYRRFEDVC